MNKSFLKSFLVALAGLVIAFLSSCTSSASKNDKNMKSSYQRGSYGYDVAFFSDNNIKTVELKDRESKACILLVPAFQGRVMTSTVNGAAGKSFGWINYGFIEEGKISNQFNPYGGEERLWLGPEGGPYSVYFPAGSEQIFSNWVVPKEIDTEPFEVVEVTSRKAGFRKDFALTNASGVKLEVGIERVVRLFDKMETETSLGIKVDPSLSCVAYESLNTLYNRGMSAWDEQSGLLSIWMLSMFNPSPEGVVFIPFITGPESEKGKTVNDDYFGKVPADRLIIRDGILFFKTDGKFRSKIGISPQRALPWCGSYDPGNKVLTLLWYSLPEKQAEYVNSKWGDQKSPLTGDVVNSYNDGPVDDGSIMGPFYELESSSPAAMLKPGGKIEHTQRIFHMTGDEDKLTLMTEKLFNLKLSDIADVFN